MDIESCLTEVLPFKVVKLNQESNPYMCSFVNRNQSWKTGFMLRQALLLDLGCMANVRFIDISDFEYGSELTIEIAECQSGPYVPIHITKYFCRKSTTKRICLSSLPCRYIKIVATKGVHINPKKIKLIGAKSEELTQIDTSTFKLLVANPQRIMYN